MGDSFYKINYQINNSNKVFPEHEVNVPCSKSIIDDFVRKGWLHLSNLFSYDKLESMRNSLEVIAQSELSYSDPNKPDNGTGQYLRWLLDKSDAFEVLLDCQITRNIAAAVLGPQIRFENVDARIATAGQEGQVIPWHIHLRVVPEPLPPFFCYPHAVHGLVYLDDLGPDEGALCVLPGSHLRHDLKMQKSDITDYPEQKLIYPKAGDCILMHGNLWHRTLPATLSCHSRRLVIFGIVPSWLRTEQTGGILGKRDYFKQKLEATIDPREREYLGEFYWS